MDKLTDYIRWVGDLDFHACPFRDADALILCNISYFDLTPVFADGKKEHCVSDCLPMIEAGEAKLMITGGDLGNREILEAAARSVRYGNLILTDYEDVFLPDQPLQFAAVTVRAPDFNFIAYRGTDASVAGWRESCMLSFTKTEAQQLALTYAERLIDEGAWILCGHSKGANEAQYAACLLDDNKWQKVSSVYLLDGPGFCPELRDPSLEARIDPKTVRIVPEFDVIGKLFEPAFTNTKIVHSCLDGIMQHSLASWLIEYGELSLAEQHDPESVRINKFMDEWIEKIPQQDRAVMVRDLFDAVSESGLESLDELDLDQIESILIGITGVSPTTKKVLSVLPNKLLFDGAIPKIPETKTEKLKRIFSDLRVQGIGLILASVILFFLSGVLFELTTFIVLTALAGIQTVLLIRRIVKQHGRLDNMKGRFVLLAVILALAASQFFRDHAMFLIGSVLYGILSLALAYYVVFKKGVKREKKTFLRVLNFIEGAVASFYGLGYLVIPKRIAWAFTISFAICGAIDGLLRLGVWIVRYFKGGRKAKSAR